MPAASALEESIKEVKRLAAVIVRGRTAQIQSADERGLMKATALSWFRVHREVAARHLGDAALHDADETYRSLLSGSDRSMRRQVCRRLLKAAERTLVELRPAALLAAGKVQQHPTDVPPDFSRVVSDVKMQAILARRWAECTACVGAGAPLAATVMMGGLLEALLLARVNAEPNKARVFQASSAPKEKSTGKALPLQDWTLRHFIDVAHELSWVSRPGKDIGVVLRDYRNYVHPYKELSHAVVLQAQDAALFWEVAKSLLRQLLA